MQFALAGHHCAISDKLMGNLDIFNIPSTYTGVKTSLAAPVVATERFGEPFRRAGRASIARSVKDSLNHAAQVIRTLP